MDLVLGKSLALAFPVRGTLRLHQWGSPVLIHTLPGHCDSAPTWTTLPLTLRRARPGLWKLPRKAKSVADPGAESAPDSSHPSHPSCIRREQLLSLLAWAGLRQVTYRCKSLQHISNVLRHTDSPKHQPYTSKNEPCCLESYIYSIMLWVLRSL